MLVQVIHSAFSERNNPITVATVKAPQSDIDAALEYAYRWTNNVMGSWSRDEQVFEDGSENGDFNPNVTRVAPLHNGMGLRSTSMGDRMIIDGVTYEVAMFGFEKLDEETV
jgi:hypothetical protein